MRDRNICTGILAENGRGAYMHEGVHLRDTMVDGERWKEYPRFAAPMMVLENGDYVFLHDCVYCILS